MLCLVFEALRFTCHKGEIMQIEQGLNINTLLESQSGLCNNILNSIFIILLLNVEYKIALMPSRVSH